MLLVRLFGAHHSLYIMLLMFFNFFLFLFLGKHNNNNTTKFIQLGPKVKVSNAALCRKREEKEKTKCLEVEVLCCA